MASEQKEDPVVVEDEIEDDIEEEMDLDEIDEVDEPVDADSDSEADDDSEAGGDVEEDFFEEDYSEIETTETIVPEEERITSDVLSKYELIELINIRATQISKGNKAFTNVEGLRDPISMAKKEIFDNECPLLIKRHIGNNLYEIWNPNEMSKPKI